MSVTRFTSKTWPRWTRGLELTSGHLYGLEDLTQVRAAMPGLCHGIDFFDTDRVTITAGSEKTAVLTVPLARGLTPTGAPVAIQKDSPLSCELVNLALPFDLRVRINTLDGAADLSVLEPPPNSSLARLSLETLPVLADDQSPPVDSACLYLGRFAIAKSRLLPALMPWVRQFGALVPQENYSRWLTPMIVGLGDVLMQMGGSPEGGLKWQKIAALLRFRAIWMHLSLTDLALECHALHVLLGQVTAESEPPAFFDRERYLRQFADNPPTPADFLKLAKAGWTPQRYSWRPLDASEYALSREQDGSAISITISTHIGGYLLIYLPVELLPDDGSGGVRSTLHTEWSQGNGYTHVDSTLHFIRLNIGQDLKPQFVRIAEVCRDVHVITSLANITVWNVLAPYPPLPPDNLKPAL